MRGLLILVSVLVAMSVFAWRDNVSDCSKVAVGRDSAGNKICGYYFNFEVEQEKPTDSKDFSGWIFSKLPYIAMRQNRDFVIYDYGTGKRKTKVKFPRNARFAGITKDGYLLSIRSPLSFTGGETRQFYNFDGEKVWETKNVPSFFTVCQDVVVSSSQSKAQATSPYKWIGQDIKTGALLWETKTKSEYHDIFSCTHISAHDSTKVYLIADSLICLDLINGSSVQYPFKSGEPSDLVTYFLDGGMPDTIYDPNLSKDNIRSRARPRALTGLHSNWIEKGDTLFIADVKNLYAFNKELKPYWHTPLAVNKGSKTSIRLVDDKILLFNYGVGFYRGNIKPYGIPFAASVSIEDGKLLSATHPETNDHMIGGYYTDSGRIYWLTRRELFYCDEGESELHKIDWKSRVKYYSRDNRMRYAIQDTVWIERDNRLEPIATDKDQVVIEDWDKDVYVIQIDGSEEVIPADKVYFKAWDQVFFNNGLPKRKTIKAPKRLEYLILDSISGKISHRIVCPKIVAKDKNHLLIFLQDGMGFVDLDNCGE